MREGGGGKVRKWGDHVKATDEIISIKFFCIYTSLNPRLLEVQATQL